MRHTRPPGARRNRGSSSSRGCRPVSPRSPSRCSKGSATAWCACAYRAPTAARCRSWRSGRTAAWRSKTARSSRALCRRCSTWPIRSTAPIAWRFPRPASTGRWCADPISTATPATSSRSRPKFRSTGASVFAACLSAPRARPRAFAATMRTQATNAEILLPIEAMNEAKLVLTDELVTQALRREKAAKREAKAAKKLERQQRHRSSGDRA